MLNLILFLVQEICHIVYDLVKIKQKGFHVNSIVNLAKPKPKPKNNKKLILLFNYILICTKLFDLGLRRRLFI